MTYCKNFIMAFPLQLIFVGPLARLITVRNSGCSLKQEELINLFDSFYRGSNVGSADGSGLGLYISRQLMQKMDGEVFAEIKEDDFCATVVVRKA